LKIEERAMSVARLNKTLILRVCRFAICNLQSAICNSLALLLVFAPVLPAQYAPPPLPAAGVPPLLYVKIIGPAGMQVTFYRGCPVQTLAAPCVVGLRPGYVYRVQLTGMPGHPGQAFYPTLEVRGTLQFPLRMRCADFPVPIVFSDADFRVVRGGGVVTRLVVLERPDVAIPEASRVDQPIELTVPPERDPEIEAREHGRTLLVERLGQRQLSPEELAAQGIPGTVLLPGEHALPPASALPWLPWACMQVYDPVLGPPNPSEELCIPDGGDFGMQAGHDREGRLRGLDAGDTVAQYADSHGRRHIAVSNRVCICVPRYLVLRTEAVPLAQVALVGPFDTNVVNGSRLVLARVPPLEQHQVEVPLGLTARQHLSGSLFVTGPLVVGQLQGARIFSTLEGPGTVTGLCLKPVPTPCERPLHIIKWPDRCGALIGDVVTFYLKYTNQGGLPITDIAVSDSLAGRFEYVPGSTRSDRDAVFTTQPNEAGSLIVRWEVAGALPPGQSGTVSFQVRIR
jgi:uncharacterized repeat protein (TIGR01451 family)